MNKFSESHVRILGALERLSQLARGEVARDAVSSAVQASIAMFDDVVVPHHRLEETQLFPSVLTAARGTPRVGAIEAMVRRMTAEHKTIEDVWVQLREELEHLHFGAASARCTLLARRLVTAYTLHAAFEEIEFLPLAEDLVGRSVPDAALTHCMYEQ
ncbi:hemerythrin domain-containing protein [Ramlibacter sp. WS9]|uniref:hemerythrin domain-containing protein n=1 Tax=Ramlibacter sp. WS9 TaxID=1882741 RepID=UPI0013050931|nr:hemerythrin domain-containing protein [Ramlibacter sp. WS9]